MISIILFLTCPSTWKLGFKCGQSIGVLYYMLWNMSFIKENGVLGYHKNEKSACHLVMKALNTMWRIASSQNFMMLMTYEWLNHIFNLCFWYELVQNVMAVFGFQDSLVNMLREECPWRHTFTEFFFICLFRILILHLNL